MESGKLNSKPAFTLVELLVATAVIAIIATIGIMSAAENRAKARDVNRKQAVNSISLSLEQRYAATKTYFVQMPGSGAECSASRATSYDPTKDMFMRAESGDTARCVGYRNGGAGLVNAKSSSNPVYPAVNSVVDALIQGGYLAKVPLDPTIDDFAQVPETGKDFLLVVCDSEGKPAASPVEATEYSLLVKLEKDASLSNEERDSVSRGCGGPGSPWPFDVDIAARKL